MGTQASSPEFTEPVEQGLHGQSAIFAKGASLKRTEVSHENANSTEQYVGKVKWFNNKAGFGFITVSEGKFEIFGKDIFVHYSSIRVNDQQQYKYLVQGEYVSFELSKPENSKHEFHAVNVRGTKGGSLMCETRKTNTVNRPTRENVRATVMKEFSQGATQTAISDTKEMEATA